MEVTDFVKSNKKLFQKIYKKNGRGEQQNFW